MATDVSLSDTDRNKLDAIVMRMTTEKESDDTIRAVVNDFKTKYAKPTDVDPRMPYQQTPEGRAVAQRYGVLPSQQQEARNIVQQDIESIPRMTAKTIVRGVPAAAGATIGAGLGPLGAVAGGGLGYSIGGRLEELVGLEPRPATVPEAMGRAAEDVPIGSMYEMGGQTLGSLYAKFLAPRAGAVTPAGEKLSATLKEAGITPNPVDVAPGGILGKLEPLAAKQVGGGRITEAGQREVAGMRGDPNTGAEGWLGKEARRVSGPNHQLDASRVSRGETIQSGLKDIAQAHRVGEAVEWEFPKLYETGTPDFDIEPLRAMMRQRMVDRGTLRQAVTPQTSSRLSSPGGRVVKTSPGEAVDVTQRGVRLETGEMMPTSFPRGDIYEHGIVATPPRALEGGRQTFVTERATRSGMTSDEMIAGLAQGEGPITFTEAKVLRKALGEMYEQGDKAPLQALRQAMEADAIKNPARAKAWQDARTYTKDNIIPFQHDQPLGRLIDKNEPMAVVNELMQPRDARIALLRAVEKQTGRSGPVWEATTSEALTRAIEDPRVLKQLGPETKALLFTKEQQLFLDKLQNWSETSRAAIRSRQELHANTGANIVSFDQLRHGVTLFLGSLATAGGAAGASPVAILGGAAILLTPNIVARMVTNPTTAKWLAQGFSVPAGTSDSLRILSQLVPSYLKAVGEEKAMTRRPQ